MLIVDQFEELFTQCTDSRSACVHSGAVRRRGYDLGGGLAGGGAVRGAAHFGGCAGASSDRDTCRLYSRCAAYPELVPFLQDNQVLVGPLDQVGLRATIEGPAASAGLVVDAGLVEICWLTSGCALAW